ncbi:MAG: fibro-slime domain-containing protein, partial [Eubacterium sp.]|nr:fibro-slime domain-containing protein [Eubacterium sp.]
MENDLNKKVDTYFAVELEASFTQTPNGQDAWGHDIIFEFTGDDDFWLYVDGELVIDLGGIHSSVPGSVNFRTGEVRVNGRNTTIRDLFYNNYLGRGNHTEAEAQAYVDEIFVLNENGQWIFKDYSTHDMKMFYMERGAGASNLKMRFNLAAVKKGSVQLSKELDGVDDPKSVKAEFPYQILYKTEDGSEHYLTNHLPDNSEQNDDYVFYKDSVNPVKYQQTLEIDGITYKDVFFLKPGETAEISFPENMTTYRIVECGINTDVYREVEVNGNPINGTPSGNRMNFGIDEATTEERPKVKYVNKVNPDALRTLTIKKVLYDETGTQEISYTADGTYFSFRLYLASEYEDLDVADMHSYHVKDPDGYYCSWNRETQKFEMIGNGITEYNDLTEQQQQDSSINFTTSIYGTIGKIPAGYSVEVRNVLAGTKFKVVERPGEVPDGYSFQKYEYYEAGYSAESQGKVLNDALTGVSDTVVTGKDPHVEVCNLKGWGLRVNKIWSDEDYMAERDDAYFAVFIARNNPQGNGDGNIDLVDGTVRRMSYGANPQTLYWYFDRLEENTGFDNYLIREVELSGDWEVDENGVVSNISAEQVRSYHDNSKVTLNGIQKGESSSSSFTYSVRYAEGEVSSDSNVRVDTVTNDRPGIILKKTNWSGNPLPGAEFTLKEGDNEIGTFTSGTDGIITVAFLGEGKNYTLTETNTPQGFHGLESPLTIRAENGNVSVNESDKDGDYYTLTQASGNTLAAVTIKNRPFTFKAVKKDGDTQQVLS